MTPVLGSRVRRTTSLRLVHKLHSKTLCSNKIEQNKQGARGWIENSGTRIISRLLKSKEYEDLIRHHGFIHSYTHLSNACHSLTLFWVLEQQEINETKAPWSVCVCSSVEHLPSRSKVLPSSKHNPGCATLVLVSEVNKHSQDINEPPQKEGSTGFQGGGYDLPQDIQGQHYWKGDILLWIWRQGMLVTETRASYMTNIYALLYLWAHFFKDWGFM